MQKATFMQKLSPSTKKLMVSLSALIILYAFFAIVKTSQFMTQINQINILHQIVVYSIVGFGMTYVLVGGCGDLSAGSTLGLAGMIMFWCLQSNIPTPLAFIITILAGAAMGIINGISTQILGVIPFIATLGTQWVFRGLTYIVTNGRPVFSAELPKVAAKQAEFFGASRVGAVEGGFYGIPVSVIIMLILGVFMGILLSKTSYGRKLYACGSNAEAARLSGINVVRIRMIMYILSGIMASIAGVITASRASSAQPTAGVGYEFQAIVGSVLGGVAMSGGEGNILNAITGALIMGVMRNGMNVMGINTYWQQVVLGILLVVVVAFEAYRNRKFT